MLKKQTQLRMGLNNILELIINNYGIKWFRLVMCGETFLTIIRGYLQKTVWGTMLQIFVLHSSGIYGKLMKHTQISLSSHNVELMKCFQNE